MLEARERAQPHQTSATSKTSTDIPSELLRRSRNNSRKKNISASRQLETTCEILVDEVRGMFQYNFGGKNDAFQSHISTCCCTLFRLTHQGTKGTTQAAFETQAAVIMLLLEYLRKTRNIADCHDQYRDCNIKLWCTSC